MFEGIFFFQGKGKAGLNLSNVSGIFHILIGGLVLAVFISLTQMACYSFLKSRSKKVKFEEKTCTILF